MRDTIIGSGNERYNAPAGVARSAFGLRYESDPHNAVAYSPANGIAVGDKYQMLAGPAHLGEFIAMCGNATTISLYDDADNAVLANKIITLQADPTLLADGAIEGFAGTRSVLRPIDLGIELANGLILDPDEGGATITCASVGYRQVVKSDGPFPSGVAGREGDMDGHGSVLRGVSGRQWYHLALDAGTASVQIETAPCRLSHIIAGVQSGASHLKVYDHASSDTNLVARIPLPFVNERYNCGLVLTNGLRVKLSATSSSDLLIVYHKYA